MIYYLKSRHSCSEVLCLSSETVAEEDLLSYSSSLNLDSCSYARNSIDAVIEKSIIFEIKSTHKNLDLVIVGEIAFSRCGSTENRLY